jgi:hypothetical protein
MAQFRTLRAERKAIHQQALEEAQLLAQLAYSKGEKYDPARDFPPEILQIGSDFSSAGIRRLIDRNQRLTEGRRYAKNQEGCPIAGQSSGSVIPAVAVMNMTQRLTSR